MIVKLEPDREKLGKIGHINNAAEMGPTIHFGRCFLGPVQSFHTRQEQGALVNLVTRQITAVKKCEATVKETGPNYSF